MTENTDDNATSVEQCVSAIQKFKNCLLEDVLPEDVSALLIKIKQQLPHFPACRDSIPDLISECRDVGDLAALMESKYEENNTWRSHARNSLNTLCDLIEGDQIAFDRYEVIEPVGGGGFGQVYRVRHRLVDREFAIKVLSPFGGEQEVHRLRFFQEAQMLYDLNHPSVVRFFEVGMVGRRPYIVMEYVAGRDLNKAIVEVGRIRPAEAWAVIRSAAEGVQHAHDQGIVHRDIKPSNILTAGPQRIRIIDFGLGIYIENKLGSRITDTGGQPAGGPYTAPELRQDPTLIDPRSDVFSLGAVWFELVTGGSPGGSNLAALLRGIDGLSIRHQEAILLCLENCHARFQSCSEIWQYVDGEDDGGAQGEFDDPDNDDPES